MRAAFLVGKERVEVREVPMPEPAEGEALVRIERAAICGSDLPTFRAEEPCPDIQGHESAGTVVASRSERVAEGDRVILYAVKGCLRCDACRAGDRVYCPDLDYVVGGFGEFAAVRAEELLPMPEWMSFGTGAVFGDSVGLAWRALHRLRAERGETCLVIGLGPVGLSMLLMAKALGLRVLGTEISAYRRELAASLGADEVIDPQAVELEDALGDAPDVAIDTAGREATQLAAMRLCRKGGRVAFIGGNTRLTLNPNKLFLGREITVCGSWYFNILNYARIVDFIRGRIDPERLVTHTFPLTQAQQAFDTFAGGESGKVLVRA